MWGRNALIQPRRVEKIVSGGQTGVDRGALDAAIRLRLEHGGWCPRGRRAEDGIIPPQYQLCETASEEYEERTRKNVIDSHGTLILARGPLAGGTLFTAICAGLEQKPLLHIDLERADHEPGGAAAELGSWLILAAVRVLNVAGCRESQAPGIQEQTRNFLERALAYPSSSPSHRGAGVTNTQTTTDRQ